MINYYDTLGVDHDATDSEIEEAYAFGKKAMNPDTFDPDTHPKEHARARHMTKRMEEAREALLDPVKRAAFNSMLDAAEASRATAGVARVRLSLRRRGTKERKQLPEFLNVPWGIRDILVFIGLWFGIQIVVILLLRLIGPYVPAAHQFLQAASNNNVGAAFALDLLDAAAGFAVVAFFLRRYRVGWKAVGWRKVKIWKALGYLAAILVIFIALSNLVLILVSVLVPSFNANQAQTNEFTGSAGSHQSLALIALVLLPPILEETIFRGFLFPALAKKWGVGWGAIISSAIFGIAHAQANISIYTFVLGLLLCFMYVRLKSIFPGMAVHMLNNYLAYIALTSK